MNKPRIDHGWGEDRPPQKGVPLRRKPPKVPNIRIHPFWEGGRKTIPPGLNAEKNREHGKQAAPGRPDDLKRCDVTRAGDRLLGVLYAYDWVAPNRGENAIQKTVLLSLRNARRWVSGGRVGGNFYAPCSTAHLGNAIYQSHVTWRGQALRQSISKLSDEGTGKQ